MVLASSAQLSDYFHDDHSVPHQDSIGQQAQATSLVRDLLIVARSELAAVAEEQPARQDKARITQVKLNWLFLPNPSEKVQIAASGRAAHRLRAVAV
jgi:hypothetical protein